MLCPFDRTASDNLKVLRHHQNGPVCLVLVYRHFKPSELLAVWREAYPCHKTMVFRCQEGRCHDNMSRVGKGKRVHVVARMYGWVKVLSFDGKCNVGVGHGERCDRVYLRVLNCLSVQREINDLPCYSR